MIGFKLPLLGYLDGLPQKTGARISSFLLSLALIAGGFRIFQVVQAKLNLPVNLLIDPGDWRVYMPIVAQNNHDNPALETCLVPQQ